MSEETEPDTLDSPWYKVHTLGYRGKHINQNHSKFADLAGNCLPVPTFRKWFTSMCQQGKAISVLLLSVTFTHLTEDSTFPKTQIVPIVLSLKSKDASSEIQIKAVLHT